MSIDRPADRYGSHTRTYGRWLPILIGVLVVAAGLAVAFLGYQRFGPKDIDSSTQTYTAADDSTLNMTFSVTRKDPSRPAVCIIRARSTDGDEAGRREVFVAASPSATVHIDSTVRTSKPPAVGDVYGCGFDVPAYLRKS